MPLNPTKINEILPFAPEGEESLKDLEPLSTYKTHILRRKGNQTGTASRPINNRVLRQTSHITTGLAQFIANRINGEGVKDDGDVDAIENGIKEAIVSTVSTETIPNIKATTFTSAGNSITNTGFKLVSGVDIGTLFNTGGGGSVGGGITTADVVDVTNADVLTRMVSDVKVTVTGNKLSIHQIKSAVVTNCGNCVCRSDLRYCDCACDCACQYDCSCN